MRTQWNKTWPQALAAVGLCAAFAFTMTACKSNNNAPIVNGTTADASPDAASGGLAPVDPNATYTTTSSGQGVISRPVSTAERCCTDWNRKGSET